MKNFRSGLVSLIGGGVISQVLNLLALPIISRVYIPADFGVFSVFNSAILLLIPFAGASYPFAIVLAKKHHINYLHIVSLTLSVLICFIITIFLLLADVFFPGQLNTLYFFFIMLYFLCFTAVLTIQQTLVREESFSAVSTSNVVNVGGSSLVKIVNGTFFASISGLGLILGQMAGLFFQLGYLILTKPDNSLRLIKNKLNSLYILNKYTQFPKYNIWVNFVSALNLSAPVFILGIYFSSSVLGYYAMARTIMGIPANVFGSALMNVMYPEINNRSSSQKILPLILTLICGLLVLFIPTCVLMFFFLENILLLILGEAWINSSTMAFYIMIWQFFAICARATSPIFKVFNTIKLQALNDLIFTLVKFLPLFYFFYTDSLSAEDGVLYLCIISSLHNIVALFMSFFQAHSHDKLLG